MKLAFCIRESDRTPADYSACIWYGSSNVVTYTYKVDCSRGY